MEIPQHGCDDGEPQSGHTIVEVLVAMMIIALFVPAMVNLLGVLVTRSSVSYTETKVAMLAAAKMEEIKNRPFINITSGAGADVTEDGCAVSWRIVRETNKARVLVNASCPASFNQTRPVRLRTILIP